MGTIWVCGSEDEINYRGSDFSSPVPCGNETVPVSLLLKIKCTIKERL